MDSIKRAQLLGSNNEYTCTLTNIVEMRNRLSTSPNQYIIIIPMAIVKWQSVAVVMTLGRQSTLH